MKKLIGFMALLGVFGLAACSFSDHLPTLPEQANEQTPSAISTASTEEAAVSLYSGIDSSVFSPVSEPLSPLLAPEEGTVLWARGQLSDEEKMVYDALSDAVARHDEGEISVSLSAEELSRVLAALNIDHPEFFWFDGEATYITTSTPLGIESTGCTLSYSFTREECESLMDQVDAYTRACLSSEEVAAAETDYDRIKAVFCYLVNSTDYDLSEADQSFISVMTRGCGVCAGYARTFQYLMHQLGISCTYARGSSTAGENHGWNIVLCDNQWYQIDVTWGDPLDFTGSAGSSVSFTHFMLTDEEMARDHVLESEIPMPACTATAYNYYRHEGLQMSVWDENIYQSLLRAAVDRGDSWLTVRFQDETAYGECLSALIDNSGMFDLLRRCDLPIPDGGITYTHEDTFYEFSVKLP